MSTDKAGDGKFIVIEGLDGAGKSTHARHIKDYVEKTFLDDGRRCVLTSEPSADNQSGLDVRGLLLGEKVKEPNAEALLFYADRIMHIEKLIKPALKRGDWVVCERFTASSHAYQAAGHGANKEVLDVMARFVAEDLLPGRPDLTIFLDIPLEVAMRRIAARDKGGDRFEREESDFFRKVRAAYLELMQSSRCEIIGSEGDEDAVREAIHAALDGRFR